ncbi:hypothetical protein FQA39_LY18409 [Lamprigera yunnana]|nr:hypothetical protein FQA39_LY18409 [Lamprigera yunnana]
MAQINFKIINKDLAEVRRFAIDESLGSNFVFIKEKILEIFPNLKGTNLKITWKDNEGDHITIAGDEDLNIAISEMDKSAKVLYVEMAAKQNCPFGSGIDVAQLDALKGIAKQYLMAYFKARDTHWEVITSFMENHPGFATGRLNCASGRATYNSLWESLINELNALGLDIPERCGSAIQKQLMAGKQHQGSCASGLQLTAITSPGVSGNNRSLRLTPTLFSNYSEVLKLSTAASRNPLDNTRLINHLQLCLL